MTDTVSPITIALDKTSSFNMKSVLCFFTQLLFIASILLSQRNSYFSKLFHWSIIKILCDSISDAHLVNGKSLKKTARIAGGNRAQRSDLRGIVRAYLLDYVTYVITKISVNVKYSKKMRNSLNSVWKICLIVLMLRFPSNYRTLDTFVVELGSSMEMNR